MTAPLFPLGTLLITPGAVELLRGYAIDPLDLVARHAAGDWGNLDRHDRAVNNRALKDGSQLMSWYQVKKEGCPPRLGVWVITTADRETTTITTPEEN
jgi:hypothetical protein